MEVLGFLREYFFTASLRASANTGVAISPTARRGHRPSMSLRGAQCRGNPYSIGTFLTLYLIMSWSEKDLFAFSLTAKINVATSVCTGCSNSPPDWNGICQRLFPHYFVGAIIDRPHCTTGLFGGE